MKRHLGILVTATDDEQAELEFELEYLRSLTFEQRMEMVRSRSREMLRQLVESGHRSPFQIVRRK